MFGVFERWGLKHVEFDQTGPPPEGVQLVWLEAPSNPFLTMPDFEAAAAHPAPVLVDATAATPINLRPLEHGADLVLHSATKYLGGHSDVLLGAVVCKDGSTAERLREFRSRTGNRRRARPRVPLAPRAQDARSPRSPPDGDRDRARPPARRASEGRARPLPRLRRDALVRRRRRRAQGRDIDAPDPERDEPGRGRVDDGVALPLGGGPRAREPASAQRRARGRRRALGRSGRRRSPG